MSSAEIDQPRIYRRNSKFPRDPGSENFVGRQMLEIAIRELQDMRTW